MLLANSHQRTACSKSKVLNETVNGKQYISSVARVRYVGDSLKIEFCDDRIALEFCDADFCRVRNEILKLWQWLRRKAA